MNAQLPLTLRFPPDQRFECFLQRPEASAAVRARVAGERSDWLYLSGPMGSGKTHLLLAACAEAQQLGRRATYLPLLPLAGRLSAALEGHDSADLVCFDGLDAIVGNRDDEVALFHTHNRLRSAGTMVLYAARNPPAALGLGLADLQSRLGQCTRLMLEALDDDGRRAVLQQRAARRGLELDDAVLDYLFRRVGRDLASLSALLDRMDRESLAAQRRVTVPFVRQLLA